MAPIYFIATRFLFAGALLLLFTRNQFLSFRRQDIGRVLLVGIVFSAAICFWILGLHLGQHIGVGGFLTCVGVLLAPAVSRLFGDHPSRYIWMALPVGLLGLALLALDRDFSFGMGEWFYLGAALMFALHINLNARAAISTPILALTSAQLICVGLLLLPISYATESWEVSAGLDILGWFAASVLIGTSLRFLLQTYSLKLAPASHAAVILTLEPVWVALLGVIWFGETLAGQQLLGCGLIFLAVLLSRANALTRFVKQWH